MSSAPCPTVRDFPEAASALRGFNASAVRIVSDGRLLLSAAVPVQRYKQVLGALMLTRDNRAIAASLREVRYDMLTIAVAALGITVLLSLYLAGTITQPIVRLARAADEVRLARESRPEIPDLGKRGDEIGDLNDALRSMTDALWQRINAIESFAADVAHELKNPLTSLRSAIEVAARPDLEPERRDQADGDRDRRHQPAEPADLRHLRRLAARRRADARRGQAGRPAAALLSDIVPPLRRHRRAEGRRRGRVPARRQPALRRARPRRPLRPGVPQRHRQCAVVQPAAARASWSSSAASRATGLFVVTIDDEGPGIPEDNLESIFQRFYSERPTEHFGQHSGLGLSICRQIMETYGGSISASNRRAAGRPRAGRALHHPHPGGRPQMSAQCAMFVHATSVAMRRGPALARGAAARAVGRGQVGPGAAPDRGRRAPDCRRPDRISPARPAR